MKTEVAFWDTSAILSLICSQEFSTQSRRFLRSYPRLVVWWGAPVEISSALARLAAEGDLNGSETIGSWRRWEILKSAARTVSPAERVLELACDIPRHYGLRSLDSFQLAAAFVWCKERPRNRPFVTADAKLAGAAESAGFAIKLFRA